MQNLIENGEICLNQKVKAEQIEPQANYVLIRQDEVEEKVGSIILADQTREADMFSTMTGVLYKKGELSWTYGTPGTDGFYELKIRPDCGDRVMFRKYAGGHMIEGKDGQQYRLMEWTDVIGNVNE